MPSDAMKPFHPIYFLGTVLGFALLAVGIFSAATALARWLGW